MAYLLIAIIVIGIAHALYNSCVLPSIQRTLRYQMFAYRDELRKLKIIHENKFSNKLFNQMQESANVFVSVNSCLDIELMIRVFAHIKKSGERELTRKSKSFKKELAECHIQEVIELEKNMGNLYKRQFILNSLSGLIGVLSIGYVVNSLGRLSLFVRLPEKRAEEISHLHCQCENCPVH